jgi:hypothetical protein
LIERVFHPYTLWEDYGCGMYGQRAVTEEALDEVARVMCDAPAFRAAMERVVREWPFATEHNLSDRSRNRRPWLGRAAVCIATGYPEGVARAMWNEMTPRQQQDANREADEVIAEWEASRILQPA